MAMRALFHFQEDVKSGHSSPAAALQKLLLWLCSYRCPLLELQPKSVQDAEMYTRVTDMAIS